MRGEPLIAAVVSMPRLHSLARAACQAAAHAHSLACLCPVHVWPALCCRFAGAGLFDSLPTCAASSVVLDYTAEPLVWDRTQAAGLLWQCALAAVAAERALPVQQGAGGGGDASGAAGLDVEGCVTPDGTVWLLQARPQV